SIFVSLLRGLGLFALSSRARSTRASVSWLMLRERRSRRSLRMRSAPRSRRWTVGNKRAADMTPEELERKKERDRKYREENREKIRDRKRQYHIQNRERELERRRRNYWANHERQLESSRRYREENLEVVRERKRKYAQENRDYLREYGRRYRKENQDRVRDRKREYARDWREANRNRERDRQREYRDVNRAHIQQRNREYNAAGGRTRMNARWTTAEDRIALDPDLTRAEIAHSLGRTVKSVNHRIQRLKQVEAEA